ncbi:hypothetical protein K435DRAFT_796191 [Dendrothele bispora CBS 962.96]|uniref:Uncharacterized protein n=1 Tax=Dendrothele bispora (strain CBS 962.96) TaxID=1314807 RepID=A0A4V6T5G9_DENBC|nr:hypothetical protein K435DRAFT_796191 [Dendrothele bispora CBS 962.96]
MITPTEMLQSSQPTTVPLSLDDTQSGAASTLTYYTLVVLFILSPAVIPRLFRLRYPCLTLSGLRDFVDMLDVIIHKLIEGGETTNFKDDVDRLQQQINDIEHEQSTSIFRWTSVHEYFHTSVIALWNIAKCYDKAQVLHVSILVRESRMPSPMNVEPSKTSRIAIVVVNVFGEIMDMIPTSTLIQIILLQLDTLLQGFRILEPGDQWSISTYRKYLCHFINNPRDFDKLLKAVSITERLKIKFECRFDYS